MGLGCIILEVGDILNDATATLSRRQGCENRGEEAVAWLSRALGGSLAVLGLLTPRTGCFQEGTRGAPQPTSSDVHCLLASASVPGDQQAGEAPPPGRLQEVGMLFQGGAGQSNSGTYMHRWVLSPAHL